MCHVSIYRIVYKVGLGRESANIYLDIDYTHVFAFLDNNSEDDENIDPPPLVLHLFPIFFEEDDDIDSNMVVILGTASFYATSIPSGVRGCDCARLID